MLPRQGNACVGATVPGRPRHQARRRHAPHTDAAQPAQGKGGCGEAEWRARQPQACLTRPCRQCARQASWLGASSLRAAKAEAKADTRAVGAMRNRGVGGECSARVGWVVERIYAWA